MKNTKMTYVPTDYVKLLGINGLSDEMMKNHFSLYEGYVKNTNHLIEHLEKEEDEVVRSELKRRFGWEFNGMRLHEYYFNNLTKGGKDHDHHSELHKQFEKSFGSHENWEKDFRAMCAMRGVGWVVLYYDRQADRLFNIWVNEHDTGHLTGCVPIIVCDYFEHAYMLDYGTKRAGYIEAFFKNLDWREAEKRFKSSL